MNELSDRQRAVEEIADLLRSLRELQVRRKPREPWLDIDLTMKQLKILFVLAASGPQRSNALAAAIGISAASATGVFDRLEHQGYVARSDDALDRRAVVVQLSESGSKVVADLQMAGQDHLRELLDDLSEDDLAALRRGFSALVAAADARATRSLADVPMAESPAASG